MIPSTAFGLVLLLPAVGPGYLYVRKAERFAPKEERTRLREAAELLVIGSLSTFVAAAAVFVAATQSRLIPTRVLDKEGTDYLVLHPVRALGAVLLAMTLSYLIVFVAAKVRFRGAEPAHEPGSIWWKLLTRSADQDEVWATVELLDGRSVQGQIEGFDMSVGGQPRDLALAGTLRERRPDGVVSPLSDNRIILSSEHIRYIGVLRRQATSRAAANPTNGQPPTADRLSRRDGGNGASVASGISGP